MCYCWCGCGVLVQGGSLELRVFCVFFFFKQKTAYEMRISDWSSDVCSSDLLGRSATEPGNARWCCAIPIEMVGPTMQPSVPAALSAITSGQIASVDRKSVV